MLTPSDIKTLVSTKGVSEKRDVGGWWTWVTLDVFTPGTVIGEEVSGFWSDSSFIRIPLFLSKPFICSDETSC